MEKQVNDIYSQCEEKLNFSQLESLIDNLETLAESKWMQEEKDDIEENWYEESPSEQVARENCEAIS